MLPPPVIRFPQRTLMVAVESLFASNVSPSEASTTTCAVLVSVSHVGLLVGVLMVMPFFTGGFPVLGRLSDGVLKFLHLIPFTSGGGR